MNKDVFYLLIAFLGACGQGAGPEPENATKDPSRQTAQYDTAATPPTLTPEKSGRGLRYEFVFSNATSTVTACSDGPFAIVNQTWTSKDDTGQKHWGADKVRMIFDNANKELTVVNQTKNTFVKVDAARMAKAEAGIEEGTPISLGNLGAAKGTGTPQAMNAIAPLSIPLPAKAPKKKHPNGCEVFERDLPGGLKEETCFSAFAEDLAVSDAFKPLVGLGNFVSVLERRVRDLETVAAVANALDFDTGIPASQFKFGDSPFEEDTPEMEAWDRSFVLIERFACQVRSDDLTPPKDAVEEYGILPWSTPFIVTALPK